jgi:hypothetical protein
VTKATAVTAVKKLELSQLNPNEIQREMMGDDLDLDKLNAYLKSQVLFDATARVVDINVNRTIEGASTIDLEVNDYDRSLLRSGALNQRLDINIDGLWFRLVKVAKDAGDDNMTLTFEQREIAILRTYPKSNAPHKGVRFVNRDKMTRAEFILSLIREVKEFAIPTVIPHLRQIQPIKKTKDAATSLYGSAPPTPGTGGIPLDVNGKVPEKVLQRNTPYPGYLTVKGVPIQKDQINNANTILTVAQNMGANPKVSVCSIMTAIQESTLHNLSGGDGTSVGLFQQTTYYGSFADRHDPATAARMFLERCIKEDASYKGFSYNDLCQNVQRSGHPDLYGQWQDEATRICAAFGLPPASSGGASTEGTVSDLNNVASWAGASAIDNSYYYYRGVPDPANGTWKREDNWTCIQRLAQEVEWRAFFISDTFYYLTDEDLYKTQPIATITESSKGVQGIGFDYDIGKKAATVDLPCQVGLWLAPPGSIIVLQEMGPVDGRWLVNTFARSLFNSNADINMTKPQPVLPEPSQANVQNLPTWAKGHPSDPSTSPQDPAMFGGLPGTDGSRNAIVMVAERAYQIEQTWHYKYPGDEGGDGGPARPIPDTLWSADAHAGLDCSAFATLVYKEAGCADPNDNNYNGAGNTGTLIAHGAPVFQPSPGDLVFYGGTPGYPGHVSVYVGGGQVIEIGSANGILKLAWDYRSDMIGIRRYVL